MAANAGNGDDVEEENKQSADGLDDLQLTASPPAAMSAPVAVQEAWDDLNDDGELTLADELGIEDLSDILFADRGKIFSAAGRETPIAEFGEDGVLLRPPQKPYLEEAPGEEIIYHVDERGILLNELGERRKIFGAKFRGHDIYVIGEMKTGTEKHYAAWFDQDWQAHKLFVQSEALTSDMLYRIRNRTHDGEISIFPEISTEG